MNKDSEAGLHHEKNDGKRALLGDVSQTVANRVLRLYRIEQRRREIVYAKHARHPLLLGLLGLVCLAENVVNLLDGLITLLLLQVVHELVDHVLRQNVSMPQSVNVVFVEIVEFGKMSVVQHVRDFVLSSVVVSRRDDSGLEVAVHVGDHVPDGGKDEPADEEREKKNDYVPAPFYVEDLNNSDFGIIDMKF